MKIRSLLLFVLLCPALAWCQSIEMPSVGYAEDHTTRITKVEVTATNTVVTFKNTLRYKGAWVQLNKSMYLQDAKGEERYNYIRSEGIPLRPARFTADKDYQEVEFKVYFEKLKPGTKEINVIERARSMPEQASGTKFFNYYNVSLSKSASVEEQVKVTDVVLTAPEPITDTAFAVNPGSFTSSITQNMGPMMAQMYTGMLQAQIKTFSDPDIITKLAKITKSYFDALVKAGFTQEAALKIITSKSLISMDGKQ